MNKRADQRHIERLLLDERNKDVPTGPFFDFVMNDGSDLQASVSDFHRGQFVARVQGQFCIAPDEYKSVSFAGFSMEFCEDVFVKTPSMSAAQERAHDKAVAAYYKELDSV